MNYANNANMSSAQALNHRQFEPAAPRASFTDDLRSRLSQLESILVEAKCELHELRTDKMGPWPEDPGEKSLQAVSSGQFDELLRSVELLIGCAGVIASHARVLRGGI